MNGRFLIDTNIVISIFADESSTLSHLKNSEEIFLPCIVLGELYFGVYKSGRTEKNLTRLEEFANSVTILPCDYGTTKIYGLIKNKLRLKGKPIPENDIWIASIAIQSGLILITRDAHYKEVEGLITETW